MNSGEFIQILREARWPVAVIAKILRVQRRTVYACLDGEQPGATINSRIALVAQLIWTNGINLGGLYRVLNRTLAGGGTIYLLLSARKIDELAITNALRLLMPAIERHISRDRMRSEPRPGARYPIIDEMPEIVLAT